MYLASYTFTVTINILPYPKLIPNIIFTIQIPVAIRIKYTITILVRSECQSL